MKQKTLWQLLKMATAYEWSVIALKALPYGIFTSIVLGFINVLSVAAGDNVTLDIAFHCVIALAVMVISYLTIWIVFKIKHLNSDGSDSKIME